MIEQTKPARTSKVMAIVVAVAALAASGGGCQRPPLRWIVRPPKGPVRIAGAAAKSKICAECHVEVADMFAGDKHVADDFFCVVCHGESIAHVEAEVEGAMPDRSWRRWIEEEKRYEWRMKKATLEIARFCAHCHNQQAPKGGATKTINWEVYRNSRHGVAVQQDKPDAPTCTDCHRAHGTGAEPWTDKLIVDTCAICHSDREMMQRAGLDSNVIRDFEEDKHATMPALPAEAKSSCLKCHHPHG